MAAQAFFVERYPVKIPRQSRGVKRCDRSKLFSPSVFFFLILYVEPNFPLSYSYRTHKIASGPKALSCYVTNFSKAYRQQHLHMIRT